MKRRGFSLIEILVAAVLALLVLTILTSALIPVMRNTQRSMQRLELSQLAKSASARLLSDLQSAPPGAVALPGVGTGGVSYLAIQSIQKVTDTGKSVYSDELMVYRIDLTGKNLTKKICRPADLSLERAFNYSVLQLADFHQNLPGSVRVLLNGCLREFELIAPVDGRPDLLRLRLGLESSLGRYTLEESIALRNSQL